MKKLKKKQTDEVKGKRVQHKIKRVEEQRLR